MKICCGLFPPVVVSLLVFVLPSQSGVAMAAGESGLGQTGTVPNASPPIGSAEAPVPPVDGAAPMSNPALPLPGSETSAPTAPILEDENASGEIDGQAQIDEEWRKYRHRRPARRAFISWGGGMFAQTYHDSVTTDSHDQAAPGAPVHVSGGFSAASIFQFVPETGYQFTDRFALSLQARFQYTPSESVAWVPTQGASQPPDYALALFLRAQYAFLTAGDFQAFGSGLAGFGLVGGRTFLGYVPRRCDPTGFGSNCLAGTEHSDTVSGGPVAVGVGLGVMYHIARFVALWTEVRVLSSFGPNMWLGEFNTGVAFAFPVAPPAPR